MNVVLWVVAALLAAVFLGAGTLKLTQSKSKLAANPNMAWTEHFSPGVIKMIGLQFPADRNEVGLHRVNRDVQLLADLAEGEMGRQELKHAHLRLGQRHRARDPGVPAIVDETGQDRSSCCRSIPSVSSPASCRPASSARGRAAAKSP